MGVSEQETNVVTELEQRGLPASGGDAEMIVGELGGDAAAGSAVQETDLHEERFVDFFDGVGLFGQDCGQGAEAYGAALIFFDDGEEQLAVDFVEAVFIDFEQLESGLGSGQIDLAG